MQLFTPEKVIPSNFRIGSYDKIQRREDSISNLPDQALPLPATNRLVATRRAILLGVFAIALLLAYGLLRFPSVLTASPTGVRSLLGDCIILVIYALVGWSGPLITNRIHPQILRTGNRIGLLAGAVFVAEILLEYVLLPDDNTRMGLVEYGLVLALFLLAGLWVAYQTKSWRNGLLAAIWSAVVASLIWYITSLFVFYLFNGTPQQAQVFRAEGNYADFARSRLVDINTFVMEDFMGAGFFHSLLLPALAAIFGSIGAAIGKALARLRKITTHPAQ